MQKLFISLLLFIAILSAAPVSAQQAKYVFYFIGDGMGVNQVQGTELYRGELEGKIGISPILFTQFPYATTSTTFSATNGVTDSAAAGTALASGKKTKNGTIGKAEDQATDVYSVATWAKNKGYRVGITTSVSIDHATPAAFYAHNAERSSSYEIGKNLYDAGFDFYAGSDFVDPYNKKDKSGQSESLYDMAAQKGYVIARGYKDYQKKSKKAEKMILFQSEKASKKDNSSIPYAIDRDKNDLTLSDITRSAIHFLTKDSEKGFFLMVEGGKIDWACHSNDAATAFKEVIDMDNAIKVAYEFYEQHPDETLIIITADHETGGIVLGTGKYELHTDLLKYQKQSAGAFSKMIAAQHQKEDKKFTWDFVRKQLQDNFGFWSQIPLDDRETEQLKKAYENFCEGVAKDTKTLYESENIIASTARQLMARKAMVGWQSGGHSNGYVPVFAIGAGAEEFTGRIDNTEIPKKIAEIAGYKE